jgi:hypothetical protein
MLGQKNVFEDEDEDDYEEPALLAPGFWLLAPLFRPKLRQRHDRIGM